MSFTGQKVSGLCAAFLSAALGLTGCATPKMGQPDTETCMMPSESDAILGLYSSREFTRSQDCIDAKITAEIAKQKDIDGQPVPLGAALAIDYYSQLSDAGKKLAQTLLARDQLSLEKLQELSKGAEKCQTKEGPGGKIIITCPEPLLISPPN